MKTMKPRVQASEEIHDTFTMFVNHVHDAFPGFRDVIDARWSKIDTVSIIEKGDTDGMTRVANAAREMGLHAVEGVILNADLDWETIAVLSDKDGKNKVLVFDEGRAFDPGDLSGVEKLLVYWLVNASPSPDDGLQVEVRFFNAALEIAGVPLRDCPCGCGRKITVIRHDHPTVREIITKVLEFDGLYHHAKGISIVKASDIITIAKETWGIDGAAWRLSSTTAWTPCNGMILDLDDIKRMENGIGATIMQTGALEGDIIFVDPYSARVVDDIGLPREEPRVPMGKQQGGKT